MTTTLPSSFQPLQGYPNIAASHDPPSSKSSSDGSFSHVFIVLAIILVISVIGCVFGRLFCKGESSKSKETDHVRSKEKVKPSSSNKHVRDFPGNHHHHEEDIEFGFENKLKPIPSSKVAASHDGGGGGSAGGGGLVGFKPVTRTWEARGIKGHVRFPGDIESKPAGPGHFR